MQFAIVIFKLYSFFVELNIANDPVAVQPEVDETVNVPSVCITHVVIPTTLVNTESTHVPVSFDNDDVLSYKFGLATNANVPPPKELV